MEQVRDSAGRKVDKYRFITGSLFEFEKKEHAYVCCWTNFHDNTIKKAIRSYENYLINK